MAYTNPWDETAPLGAADADTLDDIIRQLKLDIRERMNTVLDASGQWDDDPIVLGAQKRTGQVIVFSAHYIAPRQDEDDVQYNDLYFESDNTDANNGRFPLPLMKDWKITKVEVLFDKNTDTSVTLQFNKSTFGAAPAVTTISSNSHSATGITTIELFSGEETSDGTAYYWLNFEGAVSGRWRLYAVRITYDEV